MAVRLFTSFFLLSCHNSLKTDRRDSVTILFVDLCRIYCHGSEKQGIPKRRALTCTASPRRESRMMCRVQLWFGCTLTRWCGFYVVQTPALNLYHYNLRASGRTDVGEKLSKGIFSKIELDICPSDIIFTLTNITFTSKTVFTHSLYEPWRLVTNRRSECFVRSHR